MNLDFYPLHSTCPEAGGDIVKVSSAQWMYNATNGLDRPHSSKNAELVRQYHRSDFFNSEVFVACNSFLFSSDTVG